MQYFLKIKILKKYFIFNIFFTSKKNIMIASKETGLKKCNGNILIINNSLGNIFFAYHNYDIIANETYLSSKLKLIYLISYLILIINNKKPKKSSFGRFFRFLLKIYINFLRA
ncbi:hypothetical protein ACWNX4_00075 [Candidatus Vidania fulgoroideorum]